MEVKRNKRELLARIRAIAKTAEELCFILNWNRFGNDYEMIITDISSNQELTKEIKGFKSSTKSLHSGFDYFEEIFAQKKKTVNIE